MQNKQLWCSNKKEAPEGGNNRNQNLRQFYVQNLVCTHSKAQWNMTFVQHLYSIRDWNFKPCSEWHVERKQKKLKISLQLIFTIQEVSKTMPVKGQLFLYANQLHHQWWRCKISCHKKSSYGMMWITVMLTELADSIKLMPNVILNRYIMPKSYYTSLHNFPCYTT
jgi:hypothetical protein